MVTFLLSAQRQAESTRCGRALDRGGLHARIILVIIPNKLKTQKIIDKNNKKRIKLNMKSGAAMLNRETGVRPVLSRSCDAEQILKRHWETGKARRAMKQSQKNCPILTYLLLRKTGMRNHKLRFSAFLCRKAFCFCF